MVSLVHNHRSTAHLVGLANALGDLLDQPSRLVTDNPPGPLARLVAAEDAQAEAELVAHQIGALVDRGLLEHPGDAAVLYRTNAQADVLAAALRAAGVPYRMHAHADLFGERVVRDLIAYLRLAHNPSDRSALGRIADRPRRGLGAAAGHAPGRADDGRRVTGAGEPVRAAGDGRGGRTDGAGVSVARRGVPRRVTGQAARPGPGSSGYGAWLERRPDRVVQLEVVRRFRAVVQRAEVSLAEWLDALAMGEEVDVGCAARSHPAVQHSQQSKGREFRAVFLTGVEEGFVPHYHALQDDDALDGELRLLYVALTRVRERLYVSYCRQRERGGRVEIPAAVALAVRPATRVAGAGGLTAWRSRLLAPQRPRGGSTRPLSSWRTRSKMWWLATASSSDARDMHSSDGVRFTPTAVVQTCMCSLPPRVGFASDAASAATS